MYDSVNTALLLPSKLTDTLNYVLNIVRNYTLSEYSVQWRRQDLLRGGAKIEIMSRGTHGGLW